MKIPSSAIEGIFIHPTKIPSSPYEGIFIQTGMRNGWFRSKKTGINKL